MSMRNVTLFTLMLACFTYPALSLGQNLKSQRLDKILRDSKQADFNRKEAATSIQGCTVAYIFTVDP
jgi:hypothetical protein